MSIRAPDTPELSRPVRLRQVDAKPVRIEANESERAALAKRFAIPSIEKLEADLALDSDGERVRIHGEMIAAVTQDCSVSGEPFAVDLEEPILLVFVPAGEQATEDEDGEIEIELEREELDEIEYDGDTIDLGEAVAQTLALAIDPYAEGPDADRFREENGLQTEGSEGGPMAEMLAALKKS